MTTETKHIHQERQAGVRPTSSDRRMQVICSVLGPGALAFGYFKTHDMTTATWWMVGGALLAVVIGYQKLHRIQWIALILALIGVIIGILSVVFHDANIIKEKATLIEGCLAVIICIALLIGKNPLRDILGRKIRLPDETWRTLGWRLALLCLVIAIANEFIRRTQSDQIWVLFHFPGLPILHVLFVLFQWPWLSKARERMNSWAINEPR